LNRPIEYLVNISKAHERDWLKAFLAKLAIARGIEVYGWTILDTTLDKPSDDVLDELISEIKRVDKGI